MGAELAALKLALWSARRPSEIIGVSTCQAVGILGQKDLCKKKTTCTACKIQRESGIFVPALSLLLLMSSIVYNVGLGLGFRPPASDSQLSHLLAG